MIRPIDETELEAFARAASTGFGSRFDAEQFERQKAGIEVRRTLATFDGDVIVGTAEAMATTMSVPGGADLGTNAVKGIAVLPTHRRRGILTRLMERQLSDMAERGEPLAILWATEAPIYGRFGYGMATYRLAVEIDKADTALAVEPADKDLRIRLVEDFVHRRFISNGLYEDKRLVVPGMMRRKEAFWIRRRDDLMGDDAFFVVVEDGAGRLRAYATYRIDRSWGASGPEGHLSVADAISLDSDAERALWQFLLNIDLVTKVSAWHRPVDDPLPYLLHNPRQLRRTLGEGLWLRIIDLPAALSARSYMTEIDVTLNVTDSLLPANSGTWHLQGGPSGATCTPTAEEADLELDTSTLASAFLGHPSLGSPAAAGLVVEHRAGALRQATAAFCWSPAPWAVTWF
ncbi:MAG: hypothetical protein QOG03_2411 [Actinomycetota bacterium]|nr:hypothetical protein [Actinomycetota bacterium]